MLETHPDDALLNEYLDGCLDATGRQALEAHLAGCAECRLRLDALHGVFLALGALPDLLLKRDLAPGLVRAILARQAQWLPIPQTLKLGFVAQWLVALLVVLAAWPVVVGQIPEQVFVWLDMQLSSLLNELLASVLGLMNNTLGWITQWQAASADLQSSLSQSLESLRQAWLQPVALPIPVIELTILLGLAALAWLAFNGRLLGFRQPNEYQSISSKKRSFK
jgi:Putative zinc-finger